MQSCYTGVSWLSSCFDRFIKKFQNSGKEAGGFPSIIRHNNKPGKALHLEFKESDKESIPGYSGCLLLGYVISNCGCGHLCKEIEICKAACARRLYTFFQESLLWRCSFLREVLVEMKASQPSFTVIYFCSIIFLSDLIPELSICLSAPEALPYTGKICLISLYYHYPLLIELISVTFLHHPFSAVSIHTIIEK